MFYLNVLIIISEKSESFLHFEKTGCDIDARQKVKRNLCFIHNGRFCLRDIAYVSWTYADYYAFSSYC